MLKMTGLSKAHCTEVVETYALREFDLAVAPGEFVAATGPSGSGKTTFLTMAGLLEASTCGRYVLDGVDVSQLGDHARSRIRSQKIGFVLQGFHLIAHLNVFDNVDVPLRYRGMKTDERRHRVRAALERVGLAARERHYSAERSGEQRQRVAIVRALAGEPRLLLADEATDNPHSQMTRSVIDLLEELNREGATIVLVTHDPQLAARAQSNVHVIDGQVVNSSNEVRVARQHGALTHA
jgi:putative ABC transport system ATP-binding protein